MTHHTYKSDRIIEALCEVHFVPGGVWDPTIFGAFYDRVKGEFPEKRAEERRQFEIRAEEAALKQSFGPPELRMRFIAADQSAMVQLAPNLLVVNIVGAYPHWKKFKPLIVKCVQDYWAAAVPKGMSRIGLRYINRYEFPRNQFKVRELFRVYPQVPDEINGSVAPFFMRVEHPYHDSERLLLTFGETDSGKKDLVAVLLDLDHVFLNLGEMVVQGLEEKLEIAHDRVLSAFEACITNPIRTVLEGE